MNRCFSVKTGSDPGRVFRGLVLGDDCRFHSLLLDCGYTLFPILEKVKENLKEKCVDFYFWEVYKETMEKLTKMEKKNFLEKISPFIADQILPLYKPAKAKYTLAEIYAKCDLTPNRTSDIATGRKPVYETALRLLVRGGIVSIKELLKKKDLTQQERDYLESYLVYEDNRLQEALRLARAAGKDAAQMIFDGLKK